MSAAFSRTAGSLQPPSPLIIEGYASLFGVRDDGGDVVRAGAFTRSLKKGPVPMLLNHTDWVVAGSWSRMVEDARGLFVRGQVWAWGARALIEDDDLNGLSIGFRPRVWALKSDGGRLLADLDLVEVSLVAEPMLGAARFSVL